MAAVANKKARVDGGAITEWKGMDILSTKQFDEADLEHLFKVADGLKERIQRGDALKVLEGKILACVFMEPSTRTACSFLAAMQRLGGTTMMLNEQGSSAKKGETLEDTVRCLECYADALVLRHPTVGAAKRAADACVKPVLNAGDGVGEHPTQALLDTYTIRSEIAAAARGGEAGKDSATRALVAGKVIVLVGDLKHGRTVHSLALLLARAYAGSGLELVFVSPPQLVMPEGIKAEVGASGCKYTEAAELSPEVLAKADVLYVTRVQKERFADPDEYEALKLKYVVTPATLAQCQSTTVLLHPLPRVGEIDPACDADPRAAYFRQMENGMWVRMALVALVLGADLT